MASVPISVAYVNHLHTDTSPGKKTQVTDFTEVTGRDKIQLETQRRWPFHIKAQTQSQHHSLRPRSHPVSFRSELNHKLRLPR